LSHSIRLCTSLIGLALAASSAQAQNAFPATLAGHAERPTESYLASGFESVGLGWLGPYVEGSGNPAAQGTYGTGLGLIDDVNYTDLNRRGYILMTMTNTDIKGEFVFMDTVKSKTYKASVGKTVSVAAATLRKTFA